MRYESHLNPSRFKLRSAQRYVCGVWFRSAFLRFEKGGEVMGRPRKFKTAKALADAWEQYKAWCNDQKVLTHDFSSKNSEFVSAELKRSVTYTIEGFCVYVGIARSKFYETYAADERFRDIVTRMREECEVDARMKFELGVIDTKLAPLWMSRHGYSTKQETEQADGGGVQIIDDL